ncbi:MAG: glycosyltransferase [Candidatus Thorarchaeota archaeon]
MLRVVMVSPLPPEQTGESEYTASLIRELERTGKVEIVAIAGTGAAPLASDRGLVRTLSVWKHRSLLYPLRLFREITRSRPHIVHVQFGPHGKIYGGLFGELMLVLLVLLRVGGLRTTVTLHSTWTLSQVSERVRSYGKMGRLAVFAPALFRLYMRALDIGTDMVQISTVTEGSTLRRVFLNQFKYDPAKVTEIPHPCRDVHRTLSQDSASRIEVPRGDIALGFGFIRRGKGLETAISAMRYVVDSLPSAILLVAGRPIDEDGERYLAEMKRLVSDVGVAGNIHFLTKFVPDSEVESLIASARLLLFPYTESVGASGPIHNLAGYGRPIVASDTGYHMREALGGNLVLFRAGDPRDLADKLLYVLCDTDRAKSIGERIASYARRQDWRTAAVRTLGHYRSVLSSGMRIFKHSVTDR